jgi:nitroreductase
MTRTEMWVINKTTFPKKGTSKEKIHFLLRYGILAANIYNIQPWKFKIENNLLTIFPDKKRRLKIIDPKDRELWISLGCLLENIIIAGNHFGLKSTYKISKNFIKVKFRKSQPKKNILFNQITKRVTNKRKTKKIKVKRKIINELKKLPFEKDINAYLFQEKKDFETITIIVSKANEIQLKKKKYKEELFSWIRFNKKSIKKHKDGITYKSMDIPPVKRTLGELFLSFFLKPKYINKDEEKNIKKSSGIIIISSKTDSKKNLIKTGRTLQRILLDLTKRGLSYSFMNSPCQVEKIRKNLIKKIKEFPQIIIRIGYAKTISHSPRKPLEEVIIE